MTLFLASNPLVLAFSFAVMVMFILCLFTMAVCYRTVVLFTAVELTILLLFAALFPRPNMQLSLTTTPQAALPSLHLAANYTPTP